MQANLLRRVGPVHHLMCHYKKRNEIWRVWFIITKQSASRGALCFVDEEVTGDRPVAAAGPRAPVAATGFMVPRAPLRMLRVTRSLLLLCQAN